MVYEILETSEELRTALEKSEPLSTIARIGLPRDRSMWACGLMLVAEGLTSLEELQRVASKD
jgi:type II secretory ATPase GspE/PulE/Tfp pilus assembly ATPase PilB-like protein